VNGVLTRDFPYNIEQGIEPVYEELPGWQTDMTHLTSEEQFPKQFSDYIAFLEKELETPITIISIGPDREQTIERNGK
jgi:adenylosuccinate synthase